MYPSRFLPRHGIFLVRQADYLAQHGIKSTFLVPRPSAPWPIYRFPRWREYGPANPLIVEPDKDVHSVRYFRPPGGWFRRHEGAAITKGIMNTAVRLHAEKSFDAILACPMLPDATAAVAVKQHLQLPLATLSIGSDVMVYPRQLPALEGILRKVLQQVDLPVGVSRAICNRLTELGAESPSCIYLGRDSQHFTPTDDRQALREQYGWSESDVVAVFVGRLVHTKGTDELMQASRALLRQFPDFRLVLVGDGPARDEVEAFAQEPSHRGRISLAGELPPEDVPRHLQSADFLTLPSHSEGMPQCILEAMNCGLPIVATRVGGVPEAVIEGDNGLLIEPRQANQLETAMARLINDEDFRRHAGQRSLEIVTEVFDTDKNSAQLATALKALTR